MLRKIGNFFTSRLNSFQKGLTLLGCIFGCALSIALVLTGLAAIPFTGPGSLLPMWLGTLIFITLVTGSFGSAGKYMGLSIDTILNKEKLNNEKIATVAGCSIGFILSILAIPLHFVGIGIIAEKISIPVWEVILEFIPLTIGSFGSACSYIGKSIDALTNGKTIVDVFSASKNVNKDNPNEKLSQCSNNNNQVAPVISQQRSQKVVSNEECSPIRIKSLPMPIRHERHTNNSDAALSCKKNQSILSTRFSLFGAGVHYRARHSNSTSPWHNSWPYSAGCNTRYLARPNI